MQGLKILWVTVLWCIVALPATHAQDDADANTETEETERPADDDTDAAETDVVREVLETDDESYRDIDDEDFRPSEEIPADQSIAFPTDI